MSLQTKAPAPHTYRKTSIIPIGTSQSRSHLRSLYFSPDGYYLACSTGRKVVVWQLQCDGDNHSKEKWTRYVVYSLEGRDPCTITCMVWALDHTIFVGTSTGNLYLIRLSSTGTTLEAFQVSKHAIQFIALDSDSQFMAVVAGKHEIGIWEYSTEAGKNSWRGHFYLASPEEYVGSRQEVLVTSVSWCGSDALLLVICYLYHGVVTWNLAEFEIVSIVQTGAVPSGTLAPNGQTLSVPNARGTFDLYDLDLKGKSATLHDPDARASEDLTSDVRPGRFMYGGSWFIGASTSGGLLTLWDISSNLPAQRLSFDDVRLSPRLLAVSGTVTGDTFKNVRVAALGEGEASSIHIWTAIFAPKNAGHAAISSSRMQRQRRTRVCTIGCTPWVVIFSFTLLFVSFLCYP